MDVGGDWSPHSFLGSLKLVPFTHHPAQSKSPDSKTNHPAPFHSSWLLQDPDMRLRTTYKGFTEAVDLYFDHLMVRVVPLQVKASRPFSALPVLPLVVKSPGEALRPGLAALCTRDTFPPLPGTCIWRALNGGLCRGLSSAVLP